MAICHAATTQLRCNVFSPNQRLQFAKRNLSSHIAPSKSFTNQLFTPKTSAYHLKRSTVVQSASDASSSLSLAETAALDDLIDMLLESTGAEDLSKKVADNILSCDQKFWLRLAARTDTATSEEQKERLSSLARVVMQLVDAMVRKTNEQLTDSATVLQDILKAAADERTGEWTVPLSSEKITAMKATMDAKSDQIDEALLSNCFAWMRKASEDNLDGMVEILRKVLQVYAARALSLASESSSSSSSDIESILTDILREDEGQWGSILREKAQAGEISEVSFLECLQRKMENVVLGLSSGSYAQRVQAEYLKELESRAKGVFNDLAEGR